MDHFRRHYANTTFNEMHLLRSLVYFEDAEREPMPRMLRETDWNGIRARLEDEVRRWAPWEGVVVRWRRRRFRDHWRRLSRRGTPGRPLQTSVYAAEIAGHRTVLKAA